MASHRGPLPLGPRPDTGAPITRTPLPAPGGKVGDGTPVPPWSRCPVRKIFQKINPGIIHTGDGTRRQYFIYGRLAGPHCRRFKHFTAPLGPFLMDAPFAGFGGAMLALSAVNLSSRGEVLGRISGCRCPRRCRLDRRRKTPSRADFSPPAASGVGLICKGSDIRMIGINSRKGV